jgi:para-aminobenzoate synthetase component 1
MDRLLSWFCLFPDQPFIMLGGKGSRYCTVALSFEPADFDTVWDQQIDMPPQTDDMPCEHSFKTGYVGLLSYDDFSIVKSSSKSSKCFYVGRSLILDQLSGAAWIAEEASWQDLACQIELSYYAIESKGLHLAEDGSAALSWKALASDQEYLNMVRAAKKDIYAGRYYQINLLRYFRSHGLMPMSYWAQRLQRFSGPFSAWLHFPEWDLISFSPERFVRFFYDSKTQAVRLVTEPIKGTSPVFADAKKNQFSQLSLVASDKNQAELHMIVDLMRNDLRRISVAQSVQVTDPGSLHSFTNVHHLIARVESRARQGLRFRELCECLCPGGSITGAPKIEVMQAIYEYEKRSRSVFMGHVFCWDLTSCYFDSSILIRTVYRPEGQNYYDFAAGSGIVIGSSPEDELEEINAKAKVAID